MQETGQLHNKEVPVYRTVLLVHSCEGHLQQYLRSLEADPSLANAAEDEGEIVPMRSPCLHLLLILVRSLSVKQKLVLIVNACSGDPIPDTVVNIRWEIEQTEHSGKYHTLHLNF